MKYGLNAKVYAWAFQKMLKDYYKKNFPETNMDELYKAIKKEYRAMIERTPGIGGNSNEANLIGACYFFAMGKVIPGMTPELLDDIIDKSIKSDFMVKLHSGKKKKGILFSEKSHNAQLKEAEKSKSSTYEMDWKFKYEPGVDEFYLTYTQCGICRLAKLEHVEKFLPCMCKMDYAKFEMIGGKLERTKTLAAGDECCNFHVVKIL